jgi:hypothetical protein
LYGYVLNNPGNFFDRTGEGPISVTICVGLGVTDLISTIQFIKELDAKLKELDAQLRALEKSCPADDLKAFEKIKELETEKFRIGNEKVRAQGRALAVGLLTGTLCPALAGTPL